MKTITMRKTVAILVVPILITACGHKELTAPCSLRESPKSLNRTMLAFAAQETTHLLSPFADIKLELGEDRCGPLRPINSFITKPNGASDG